MKSWFGYNGHFLQEIRSLRLSIIEQTLIACLVLMCLISAWSSLSGRDVGNTEQLKLAKQQAQQELMALRTQQAE
ncbi:MAG: hypothetical protein K0Q50_1346 [Vampirovibrio sp.]|jgi:hypothetical protein|nr:hypothetical protein [Vampirovibrio sp.]